MGPCTPRGAPHHYTFTLIANRSGAGRPPARLTRDELFAKLTRPHQGRTGLVVSLRQSIRRQALRCETSGGVREIER